MADAKAANAKVGKTDDKCPWCTHRQVMAHCVCHDDCSNTECWHGPQGRYLGMPGTIHDKIRIPEFQ
ncbi:MAG TPA: hypothetical protein VN375_19200 [Vicinamibacteria bacterium]|nr:hypothetical protein [Vicinamibacteria bacterium]